ncbi:hypothetical protein H8356DRAFT_1620445 [Neocallimastix lanati (nom. inval.)]|jgi:hypothetical protein|uniref:DUF3533 domain-containing protein n=1 Tax=Neocallimastix californiae TaxID=1754190 RepID=A0A1Y2AD49_9FUNG|nr:hypothetical protein H8356DRAFT_1620445 [Neocallimastix sp. JGI-2020a]ORY20442.1 hypothetical protein LY90DRAFT_707867 [Neocallimastix californiae]|eukprot:ORY20442.1 hypothetical protein LY90DRAFT_707867 [Neocallimastix californiae]
MKLIDTIEEFKLSKKFKYFFFGMLCILFPLVITIYGIIYFGGLWDPISRMKNLKVSIVNNDEGCPSTNLLCLVLKNNNLEIPNLGEMIKTNILNADETKNLFDWQEDFKNESDRNKVQEMSSDIVTDYDRWGVIYIPQNFTQKIISNLDKSQFSSPEAQQLIVNSVSSKLGIKPENIGQYFDLKDLTTSEDATLFYIFDTARSYTSVTFVTTAFETIDKVLKRTLALKMYQTASGAGASFNNNFYLNAYVSIFDDKRPLRNFGQNFASFMLFVIIYIAAIATNLVYRKYRPFNNYIQENKTNTSIFISAICKILINMLYMLVVCAFMMIVMFMFGNAQHEKSKFCSYLIFVLWAFISLSFCHIVSNILPLLPFLGICVIFLVIQLATCGGIVANKLQPGFWNIGKAFPMYYATAELKFLMFNTGGRFSGRNILALLLWACGLAIVDIISSFVQLNNVRKQAPQTRDIEKQEMSTNNNRVTQKDIENEKDITMNKL